MRVLAVLGIVAALGATAVAVQYFREARTPEAAVRAYFAALARGDAATALAAGSVPEGGRALVSDDVLRATLERSPIDDVTTGRVTRTGDAATVNVRYRLGGVSPEAVDDTVDLRRVDGRWQLRRSAVPLTLAVDDAATWAAVPASTPFVVPADSQLVFPAPCRCSSRARCSLSPRRTAPSGSRTPRTPCTSPPSRAPTVGAPSPAPSSPR